MVSFVLFEKPYSSLLLCGFFFFFSQAEAVRKPARYLMCLTKKPVIFTENLKGEGLKHGRVVLYKAYSMLCIHKTVDKDQAKHFITKSNLAQVGNVLVASV